MAIASLTCNATQKVGSEELPCTHATADFIRSCGTVVSAMVKGSSGKRTDVSEYMGRVCGASVLKDWRRDQCQSLALTVDRAMTEDSYDNRERLDTGSICSSLWSTIGKDEGVLLEKERIEHEAEETRRSEEEKRRAEEEAERERRAAKKAAEEAAETKRAQEEAERQAAEEEKHANVTKAAAEVLSALKAEANATTVASASNATRTAAALPSDATAIAAAATASTSAPAASAAAIASEPAQNASKMPE